MLLIITTLLVSGFARADSYNEAVVGHVVTQELTGEIDKGAIARAELNKQMHELSLDILSVIFNNMPNILDGISADMRAKADKNYKCALQSDEYKNKDCK